MSTSGAGRARPAEFVQGPILWGAQKGVGGYRVEVVVVEVVTVTLGRHQLPTECLRPGTTSHTATSHAGQRVLAGPCHRSQETGSKVTSGAFKVRSEVLLSLMCCYNCHRRPLPSEYGQSDRNIHKSLLWKPCLTVPFPRYSGSPW